MRSIQEVVNRLLFLCEAVPPLLQKISEEDFSRKPAPNKWSQKEIVGHLIDSATNNHQRFVRLQFEENPVIGYDQDNWVANSHYQQMDKDTLIHFWKNYNKHLAEVLRYVKEEDLQRTGRSKADREPVTLHWLADDYITHLEHHLKGFGISL